MKKPKKDSPKCPFCNSHPTIRKGFKKNIYRKLQKYQCAQCKKHFTLQPLQQKSKTYPLKTILNTISSYNLGQSLRKLTNQNKIPKSTVHNWLKTINLPMNRLRKRINQNPILKKRFIHHEQPFLYQYHNIKLSFANRYPRLIYYLKNLEELLPKDIFKNSKRISEIKPLKNAFALKTKQNYAVQLAKMVASITNDNRKSHQIIEDFMLINDTATIAVEIPVYLTPKNPNQKNLTGHIDILQIRYNKIYILDYKPEPLNKQQAISQLFLYRAALSKLTDIPKNRIKLAFFNDKGYYEIMP